MRDDDGEYDGFGEIVADGVSSSDIDSDALSDVVVLEVVVAEGVVDGVTESDPDTEVLKVIDGLLEKLPLDVSSMVEDGVRESV